MLLFFTDSEPAAPRGYDGEGFFSPLGVSGRQGAAQPCSGAGRQAAAPSIALTSTGKKVLAAFRGMKIFGYLSLLFSAQQQVCKGEAPWGVFSAGTPFPSPGKRWHV